MRLLLLLSHCKYHQPKPRGIFYNSFFLFIDNTLVMNLVYESIEICHKSEKIIFIV